MSEQLTLFPLPRALGDPRCLDCNRDTIELGEFYMLHHAVWLQANPGNVGMLCIGCLETRLGRRLEPRDFAPCEINRSPRSQPLRSRVLGPDERSDLRALGHQ
jgi:hypothetical protein